MESLKKEYIVIHHTGIKNGNSDSYIIWESIKRSHQLKYKDRFSWYIADYHFGITKDLRVFIGNSVDYPCFHSGDDNINFKSISVAFFGNFNEELLDKKQFDLGVITISDLVKRFNIKFEKILKHSDIVNTSCPGKNFPFEELKKKIINITKDDWKKESIVFAKERGWIKGEHNSNEDVDMGTVLTVLKNFYDIEVSTFLKGGEIYGSNK